MDTTSTRPNDTRHPPEQQELRRLRHEVRDLVAQWRSATGHQVQCDAWLRGFDRAFTQELADRGWIGMTWPRRFGGAERTHLERLVVTEELLRAGAPVAAHWIADRQIGPSLLRHGTPSLQEEILPRIASGEFVFCLGMSEPEAGSDLAAARTTATPTTDGWSLSGRKIWTSHAHRANHAYVLARTNRTDVKHEGLTEFIVDMTTPGIGVSPIRDLTGDHHFNEVTFTDVAVPDHRVIGTVGNGWRQVTEQLAFERGGPERVLSTYPLLAALLADPERRHDEGALRELGTITAQLSTLRWLYRSVAVALDEGRASTRESAISKYLGTRFENELIECARRLAPMCGPEVARLRDQALLASPGFGIRGGASDVLLSIIAKTEAHR